MKTTVILESPETNTEIPYEIDFDVENDDPETGYKGEIIVNHVKFSGDSLDLWPKIRVIKQYSDLIFSAIDICIKRWKVEREEDAAARRFDDQQWELYGSMQIPIARREKICG